MLSLLDLLRLVTAFAVIFVVSLFTRPPTEAELALVDFVRVPVQRTDTKNISTP